MDRGDHGDLSANQIGRQRRQPIHLIFSPTVFDRQVFACDIARLFQGLMECAQIIRLREGRRGAEKTDHRHRRLRARGAWQRRRAGNARQNRKQVASPHPSAVIIREGG